MQKGVGEWGGGALAGGVGGGDVGGGQEGRLAHPKCGRLAHGLLWFAPMLWLAPMLRLAVSSACVCAVREARGRPDVLGVSAVSAACARARLDAVTRGVVLLGESVAGVRDGERARDTRYAAGRE